MARLALLLAGCIYASAQRQDDVDTVRQRVVDLLCLPATVSAVSGAGSYARNLLPNNTWADIDYSDPTDRAIWRTASHLARTLTLAQAVALPNKTNPYFGDPEIFNASRRALSWWSTNDPQNTNWWWDIISVPQQYGCINLLLGVAAPSLQPAPVTDFPTPLELQKALEMSFRAAWWNASLGYEATGANLAWMVQAQIARGVFPFLVNMTALSQGFSRLWEESKVVNRSMDFNLAQGIQHDWSYQFHGPQLQIGSYGQDYSGEMLLFAEVAQDTQWQAPEGALDILCSYWAEGQAWLSIGPVFEWTGVGRQVSRPGVNSEFGITLNTTSIRRVAQSCSDPATAAAVVEWADRIDKSPSAPALLGAKHFWCSDATVVRREGWVAVAHSHSTRTKVPECGNGENLQGRYMGEGVLSVYSTDCHNGTGCGGEVEDIFPLYEWTQPAGVLAEVDVLVPTLCSTPCCWLSQVSSAPFVGGVADGTYAAAAMDTRIYGLSARRSWLFFDSAILALASSVTDLNATRHPMTSMTQQWIFDPSVTVGFQNGTVASLPDGVYSLPDASWFHAQGRGWVTLPGLTMGGGQATPLLDAGNRTGNWDTIGPSNYSASGRTLRLSLDHGTGVNGASWGYLTVPSATVDDMPAIAAQAANVTVVANTDLVQAAGDAVAGVLAAVFWPSRNCTAPASGGCPGGEVSWTPASGTLSPLTVSASAPCLLTYSEGPSGVTIAASNPDTPGGLRLVVTVNRALAPSPTCAAAPGSVSGTTAITFSLPADADVDMGATVVQSCTVSA